MNEEKIMRIGENMHIHILYLRKCLYYEFNDTFS
jgi:hypothetical protein